MPTLMMTGFDRQHLPTRTIREAARGVDPRVSTGRVQAWDLLHLKSSSIPGAADWAEKTLDSVVTAAGTKATRVLDCAECEDVGFYGLSHPDDPDTLISLLRRVSDGGYEQLVAGAWRPYETRYDRQVEILTKDLAADLAEALVAGASGLTRRYWWPLAFLPPAGILAAAPAPEAAGDLLAEQKTSEDEDWHTFAIVDDLDPGAVLDLIRLRPGPELTVYRNGVWDEDPDLLAQLQGVQPPPLVELDEAQLASVMEQIGGAEGEVEGSEDTGDPGEGLDEADKSGSVAAAGDKKHTLPEGGYPIDNRDDLKKAVKAFGRAKNPNAAKRHIIKRARALNAIGLLPESWGITAASGALLADAPLTVSPDPRAERLRRYWTTGKGAAKIRWGTEGDWTRCYRQLRKYMGVRAKGYCQNLHKRSTGVWTGDRRNPGRRASAVAASGTRPAVLSMEAVLVAAMSTGRWIGPGGGSAMTASAVLKDGVYAEAEENGGLLKSLVAGAFPVAPPDAWFEDPQLEGPTPLTVDDDGRVHGHIATFDVAHIGLPGRVHAPKSRSGYAYFKTGLLRTASGKTVNVGQLTLAGGHAPLQADAAAAVAHYDNTASAVADVNAGEDRWGIWVAGGLRPEVTPSQLRTLRASAPSGDWRPINGNLELVACCQVNVPGFPTTRARVASGAITALVAAGARPLAARKLALLADAAVAERLTALEQHVFGLDGVDLVEGDGSVVVADADGGEPLAEGSVTTGTQPAEGGEPVVSESVRRARELVAQRRAAARHEEPEPDPEAEGGGEGAEGQPEAQPEAQPESQPHQDREPGEEPPAEQPVTDPAPTSTPGERQPDVNPVEDPVRQDREARMAALRERVHGSRQPVAAGAGRGN
jgi:hypothetical protein